MVSFNNTGGDTATKMTATTSQAAAKKKQPTSGIKTVTFKGDAKAESILHLKVITNGSGQSGQIIALVGVLSSYYGDKQFSDWAESIKNNTRKDQRAFMPTRISRSNYGDFTGADADVFTYHGNTPAERMDEEDQYRSDELLWESTFKAGINKWNRYEEHGKSIFLAIKGQVEPSLWDKTMDDPRFAAIKILKCPLALINLMKD